MTASKPSAALAADRVNFINEDDAWRVLFRFAKQIARTSSAYAHKHFHKL